MGDNSCKHYGYMKALVASVGLGSLDDGLDLILQLLDFVGERALRVSEDRCGHNIA